MVTVALISPKEGPVSWKFLMPENTGYIDSSLDFGTEQKCKERGTTSAAHIYNTLEQNKHLFNTGRLYFALIYFFSTLLLFIIHSGLMPV